MYTLEYQFFLNNDIIMQLAVFTLRTHTYEGIQVDKCTMLVSAVKLSLILTYPKPQAYRPENPHDHQFFLNNDIHMQFSLFIPRIHTYEGIQLDKLTILVGLVT